MAAAQLRLLVVAAGARALPFVSQWQTRGSLGRHWVLRRWLMRCSLGAPTAATLISSSRLAAGSSVLAATSSHDT